MKIQGCCYCLLALLAVVNAGNASLMDADPTAAGMDTNLAAAKAVFSLTVEGDLLSDSSSAPASEEPLTDWRVVVAPALVVENLLPVRGTFLVWEQPQACTYPQGSSLQPVCSESWAPTTLVLLVAWTWQITKSLARHAILWQLGTKSTSHLCI